MKLASLSPSRLTAAAALLAVSAATTAAPAQQRRARIPTLPIEVTVATEDGAAVVADDWIETQLTNANAIFEPAGVSFRRVDRHSMGPEHAALETRRDRHALGALLHPQVIDWFVVRSLRDVDDPSRYRQGVHWRTLGEGYPDHAHVVIVSSIAGPNVLAHELGHYFGNPHSDVPGNIMSYSRGEGPPFFDADQVRRIRQVARHFLRRGALVPARSLTSE